MTILAECLDASPPAEGAAFSSCSNVAWVTQPTSMFDGISTDDAGSLAVAVIGCWALAFGIRALVRVVRETA